MQLSIVAPVYNEVENLENLVKKVSEAMAAESIEIWEIVLVNDGSTDGSAELMGRLSKRNPHVKAVHFNRNYGQTAAMDAGMRAAIYDFVMTIDADLQNDPADVGKLFSKMEEGIGCVCGVRTKRRDSWVRLLSSRVANAVRNYVSDETITDTGCSLKLFRRSCLEEIKLYEGMHRFLPTLVKMQGYQVVEVPVNHLPRVKGVSKYGVWNRVFRSFFDLLAVRWMKKRWLNYQIENREGMSDVHVFASNDGNSQKPVGLTRTAGTSPVL